jgi:cation diffusion facilitator CzcD-associated flavoprotein CzcO
VRGSNAVVIGASISGLCAATVLSEFYEHVTVVERDSLPGAPQPRAGVPHGRHQHVLLARGLPWVSGRRTLAVRAVNAYMTLLPRAANRDPAMARAFFRVAHLLEGPASLARPNLAARLLLGSAHRGDRLTRPVKLVGR